MGCETMPKIRNSWQFAIQSLNSRQTSNGLKLWFEYPETLQAPSGSLLDSCALHQQQSFEVHNFPNFKAFWVPKKQEALKAEILHGYTRHGINNTHLRTFKTSKPSISMQVVIVRLCPGVMSYSKHQSRANWEGRSLGHSYWILPIFPSQNIRHESLWMCPILPPRVIRQLFSLKEAKYYTSLFYGVHHPKCIQENLDPPEFINIFHWTLLFDGNLASFWHLASLNKGVIITVMISPGIRLSLCQIQVSMLSLHYLS